MVKCTNYHYFYQDVDVGLDLSKSVINIFVIAQRKCSRVKSLQRASAMSLRGKVLCDISSVPKACLTLLGFIYALNLQYAKEFKHTFEVFQNLFLELDDTKLALKNKSLSEMNVQFVMF